jgi:hypothetical protein
MRRALWLGVGLAVGVVAAVRMAKAVRAHLPAGLAEAARNSAAGLLDPVRDFVSDLRTAMEEREEQIHEAFRAGVSLDQDIGDRSNGNGARTR